MFWSSRLAESNGTGSRCVRLPVSEKKGWSQKSLTSFFSKSMFKKILKLETLVELVDLLPQPEKIEKSCSQFREKWLLILAGNPTGTKYILERRCSKLLTTESVYC